MSTLLRCAGDLRCIVGGKSSPVTRWLGRVLIVVLAFVNPGCASVPLTPAGTMVRQVFPGSPGCRFIGSVNVDTTGQVFADAAAENVGVLNKFKNTVASMGGNAYVVNTQQKISNGVQIIGEAYQCPQ